MQHLTTNNTGGGTLTLTGAQIGSSDPESVALVFTDYQGPFALTPDAGGGTDIAICYVRGTNILTPIGNLPVESLGVGDPLVTRFGGIRPVKWIGRQSYDLRFLANSPARRPIRIRAGALAPGMPARDLLVSPGHSLLLGDTLVLASRLINCVTPLRPAAGARHKLEAALRPAAARAAAAITPGPLEGYVDTVDAWHIHGWALDTAHPNLPVLLDLRLGKATLGTALACQPRDDLRNAGKGTGRCAFTFTTPSRLPADALARLTIRRNADGAPLSVSFDADRLAAPAAPTGLRIVA